MNPVELQRQLRENSNDLETFYQEVSKWSESVNKKKQNTEAQNGFLEKKERNNMKNDLIKVENGDVNGGMEKAALENKKENKSETNKKELALVEKKQGNDYVKLQKWHDAIDCYTKAIELYRHDPVFYANRALCYLKTNKMHNAISDANLSLKLDAKYVKAYQRRAAALEQLGRLSEAECDLIKVLEHEPNNKETKQKLEAILSMKKAPQKPVSKFTETRRQHKNGDQSTGRRFDENGEIVLYKAVATKPTHLRSKKPLTRLEIAETGKKIEAIKDQVIERKAPENKPVEIARENHDAKVVMPDKLNFYKDWPKLESLVQKYDYLKRIEAKDFVEIFKDSLDSDIFSDILRVLSSCFIENNESVYEFLTKLGEIKRFSTLTCFASSEDKKCIWKLIDYVKEHEKLGKEHVEKLAKSFSV